LVRNGAKDEVTAETRRSLIKVDGDVDFGTTLPE
jgi:hypothetical protein